MYAISPRNRRRVGGWLSVLALWLLTLQGLHHFQPRMLAMAEICLAGDRQGEASNSEGQLVSHDSECTLYQGRLDTPPLPSVEPFNSVFDALVDDQTLSKVTVPAISRVWSIYRPRGPPDRV